MSEFTCYCIKSELLLYQGVQRGFKIRAVIFPVGLEFEDLPIDGFKLSPNPGTIVKLSTLMIEDFIVINNDCESVV